jgi:S-disulfanyl-L-cysteine oxidoreductase SoxD
MCKFSAWLLSVGALMWSGVAVAAPWHALGRAVTPAEMVSWDIDVRPDGTGLPPGRGSVADGQGIYDAQCASCHGTFGESTDFIALTGGIGSLATDTPQRTVGSKLNYATTLWDYINRAMPFNNSKTLTVNEVYAVTAYVLNLNEIVPAEAVLDEQTLPQVRMPNREGFTTAHGMQQVAGKPDVVNRPCMQACATTAAISSELPAGFTAQMYGDLRPHFRQFVVTNQVAPLPLAPTATGALDIARSHGCLACHGTDHAIVGPAFEDVGKRYAQDPTAAKTLALKIKQGGSGIWGSAVMPPQAQVPDGELSVLVTWLLARARNK